MTQLSGEGGRLTPEMKYVAETENRPEVLLKGIAAGRIVILEHQLEIESPRVSEPDSEQR